MPHAPLTHSVFLEPDIHYLPGHTSLQTLAALIGRTIVALAQHATDARHRLHPDFLAEFMVLCITSLTSQPRALGGGGSHRPGGSRPGGSGGRQLRLTMLSELPFAALLNRPGLGLPVIDG